jgi:hypothetical protein
MRRHADALYRVMLQGWSRAYGSAPELTKQIKKEIKTIKIKNPNAPCDLALCSLFRFYVFCYSMSAPSGAQLAL